MAFNLPTFKTRALSAAVFVIVMACGVFISHWTFFLLFTIIHFGCWLEYHKLVSLIDPDYRTIIPFHKYGVMLLGWAFMMWMTNDAFAIIGRITLYEVGWWIMMMLALSLPLVEVLLSKQFNLKNTGYSLIGLLYISVSLGLMIDLRAEGILRFADLAFFDLGWVFPAVLIASLWINDTMAYIVGSFIGKTPLSSISPKKTWEGTLGGAILAIATVSLVGYFLLDMSDYISLIAISAIAAVMGTLGDLFESKLKRLAGVKDSGSMMPGHGGFLDRFDSLIMSTPFVWLYIKLFL